MNIHPRFLFLINFRFFSILVKTEHRFVACQHSEIPLKRLRIYTIKIIIKKLFTFGMAMAKKGKNV
jgi:hypothetical protein